MATSAIRETSPTLKRRLLAWLPTILWLAMIFSFSTDTFSASNTGSILLKVLRFFYPSISDSQFSTIHIFIRKGAHFSVYGILSGLAFYSWKATLSRGLRWTFTWSGLALLLTLAAASLDEFHQSFVPSRTATPRDVLLDMMGAVFVQVVIASFWGQRRASKAS